MLTQQQQQQQLESAALTGKSEIEKQDTNTTLLAPGLGYAKWAGKQRQSISSSILSSPPNTQHGEDSDENHYEDGASASEEETTEMQLSDSSAPSSTNTSPSTSPNVSPTKTQDMPIPEPRRRLVLNNLPHTDDFDLKLTYERAHNLSDSASKNDVFQSVQINDFAQVWAQKFAPEAVKLIHDRDAAGLRVLLGPPIYLQQFNVAEEIFQQKLKQIRLAHMFALRNQVSAWITEEEKASKPQPASAPARNLGNSQNQQREDLLAEELQKVIAKALENFRTVFQTDIDRIAQCQSPKPRHNGEVAQTAIRYSVALLEQHQTFLQEVNDSIFAAEPYQQYLVERNLNPLKAAVSAQCKKLQSELETQNSRLQIMTNTEANLDRLVKDLGQSADLPVLRAKEQELRKRISDAKRSQREGLQTELEKIKGYIKLIDDYKTHAIEWIVGSQPSWVFGDKPGLKDRNKSIETAKIFVDKLFTDYHVLEVHQSQVMQGPKNNTLLHEALNAYANPNGYTPTERATDKKQVLVMVEMLYHCGANALTTNGDNQTAYQYADLHQFTERHNTAAKPQLSRIRVEDFELERLEVSMTSCLSEVGYLAKQILSDSSRENYTRMTGWAACYYIWQDNPVSSWQDIKALTEGWKQASQQFDDTRLGTKVQEQTARNEKESTTSNRKLVIKKLLQFVINPMYRGEIIGWRGISTSDVDARELAATRKAHQTVSAENSSLKLQSYQKIQSLTQELTTTKKVLEEKAIECKAEHDVRVIAEQREKTNAQEATRFANLAEKLGAELSTTRTTLETSMKLLEETKQTLKINEAKLVNVEQELATTKQKLTNAELLIQSYRTTQEGIYKRSPLQKPLTQETTSSQSQVPSSASVIPIPAISEAAFKM